MLTKSYGYWLDNTEYSPVVSEYSVFTPDEIEEIHSLALNTERSTGISPATIVGKAGKLVVDDSVRITDLAWLLSNKKENQWIYDRLSKVIHKVNCEHYGYDLNIMENIQYSVYTDVGGYYGKHIDSMYRSQQSRKLSITIQLSDPHEYEGGDLLLYNGGETIVAPKDKGVANFFPSYLLHEVTPVTKGKRVSLVCWQTGPRFK